VLTLFGDDAVRLTDDVAMRSVRGETVLYAPRPDVVLAVPPGVASVLATLRGSSPYADVVRRWSRAGGQDFSLASWWIAALVALGFTDAPPRQPLLDDANVVFFQLPGVSADFDESAGSGELVSSATGRRASINTRGYLAWRLCAAGLDAADIPGPRREAGRRFLDALAALGFAMAVHHPLPPWLGAGRDRLEQAAMSVT
jgi:hypothetical protein